jgi:subtilisin family serine protease
MSDPSIQGLNSAQATSCAPAITAPPSEYLPDELIVKLKPGEKPEKLAADHGASEHRREFRGKPNKGALKRSAGRKLPDLSNIYRLKLPPGTDLKKALERLGRDKRVEYAAPVSIPVETLVPNDPDYSQQWHLPKISAPAAWDITTGSSAVTIAIIDSGLDYNHPDFIGRLWTNSGETAANGIDDDGNGYIDDVNGWDFCNGDNDVYDAVGCYGTVYGHGTMVAGVAAATGNNSEAVSGLAMKALLTQPIIPAGPA